MSSPIDVQITDQICSITINRPEVRNALNVETVKALTEAFKQCAGDSNVRVVILRGTGKAAFCAGADLKELNDLKSEAERVSFFKGVADLIRSMNACPKPIVAQVFGAAVAGGCGLVAASDLAYASEDASFGLPEAKIGLVPMVVLAPLSRSLNRKALMELSLTAAPVNASRAVAIGLINAVHPAATLEGEVESLAKRMAELPSGALAAAKRALLEVPEERYEDLFEILPQRIAKISMMPEAAEHIARLGARK